MMTSSIVLIFFQNNCVKISLGIMLESKMNNKAMEKGKNELLHPYFIFRTDYLDGNRFGNFSAL